MKKIIYILLSLLFLSCYTVKKAEKQVIKANVNFPLVTSNFCGFTFPVKEKIIEKTKLVKGETIIQNDTITIDCDEVVQDKNPNNKVLVKYQNIYRTDTVFKELTIEKENTAKVRNLELQLKDKDKIINEKKAELKMLTWVLIAVSLGLFLVLFLRLK